MSLEQQAVGGNEGKRQSPSQLGSWEEWNALMEEICQVAEKFVLTNCFEPSRSKVCQVTDG